MADHKTNNTVNKRTNVCLMTLIFWVCG
jgi:hypothetical protein